MLVECFHLQVLSLENEYKKYELIKTKLPHRFLGTIMRMVKLQLCMGML
jgi:hypothetical protein